MAALFGLALCLLFAAPAAVTLSVVTYSGLSAARFFSFLATVLVYVAYGRFLRAHDRPRFWPGVIIGATSAFLGTLLYQYIIRLPLAQATLIHSLPGVPPAAAVTMLQLHQRTGALLSGFVAAGLNGVLGGTATWWGGRRGLPRRDPEPEERQREDRASSF